MTRRQAWLSGAAEAALFLGLSAAYVALLLATVHDLGYARDEGFYFHAAGQYRKWFELLFEDPAAAMERDAIDRYWKANHEHPAFVKSLFALSNLFLFRKWEILPDGGTSMRFPAMVLSGLAVAVVYRWGRETLGRLAGLVAAVSLAMMPHVFYHAHLDCFDMPVLAMWLFTTYAYWKSLERGGLGWVVATGVLYGLLLNTKHNAWLLPPALIAHFVITRGWRGLRRDLRAGRTHAPLALLSMATLGPALFYTTWPWLWHNTATRFSRYVAFHTGHDYYNIEFLGETYFRPPMPLGYAWVMTLATVPTITLVLFGVGLVRAVREDVLARFSGLLGRGALSLPGFESPRGRFSTRTLWVLCLLTSYAPWLSSNTPIFGGTKHWMTAYPFLCLLGASGFDWVRRRLSEVSTRARMRALTGPLLACCAVVGPVVMALRAHPWGLAAYVPLVGGAPGGASLGLYRSFWGYTTGAIQDELNERAPRGARVYLHDMAPNSWKQMQRDGRIRSDLNGTLTLHASDLALYHHEQHMARVEYQIWVDYGTVRPSHVGLYDGVPVVWLYKRPRSSVKAERREAPDGR
jgi:4-amino-4-deoxy-L-arabinose transferase-like glycosyltransferase